MSTLVLSGWAQPADALAHLAEDAVGFDYSDYTSSDAAMEALEKFKHAKRVIAWSLGGQLAMRAITAGMLQPRHVTLIAAPYRFVTDADVKGMDPIIYQQFRANYAADPGRSKGRFHGLIAKGDREHKRILAELRHHPHVEDTVRWLPWLDDLAQWSLAAVPLANMPPTLIIHGMNDVIVPHGQGVYLAEQLPRATLSSWEGVGHAPHLHDAARVRAEISAHRVAQGGV